MSADMNTTREQAVRWFAERRLAGMAGVPNGYDYDDADALIAAGWQPPGGVVVDTEQLARELYRRLYPGATNIHDSVRTAESDRMEADRAYRWWDEGKTGPSPRERCLEIAQAIVASGLFTSRTEVERAAAIKATDDAIAVLSKEGWFSPGIEAIASVLRATDGNN